MSFNEGDLHERYADVFRAMGMDVPREFTRERHDRLIEGIARCRDMNAASVIEINRQERVIEELREKEAAYMDANHEQGMQLIEQGKRVAELERMLEHDRLEIICYENDVDARDALICDMWPLVLADGASEAFAERMRELGIEVP